MTSFIFLCCLIMRAYRLREVFSSVFLNGTLLETTHAHTHTHTRARPLKILIFRAKKALSRCHWSRLLCYWQTAPEVEVQLPERHATRCIIDNTAKPVCWVNFSEWDKNAALTKTSLAVAMAFVTTPVVLPMAEEEWQKKQRSKNAPRNRSIDQPSLISLEVFHSSFYRSWTLMRSFRNFWYWY